MLCLHPSQQVLRRGPSFAAVAWLLMLVVVLWVLLGARADAYGAGGGRGPAVKPGPPLVVVSIDGLLADHLAALDELGLQVPQLRRLLREGTRARLRGVLPTLTYPSHVTLVTGCSPARHGVLNNRPLDPAGRNQGGWSWYAEDIRVPTLWDVAGRARLRTAAVDWPVTVGAHVDALIPQFWRAGTEDDAKLLRALSTPGLLAELEGKLGPYPRGYDYTLAADRKRTSFAEALLQRRRPQLLLAYLGSFDEEAHSSGPRSAATLAALEALDGLLGRLRAAAERSGGGVARFALVSDHGFAAAKTEVSLNAVLRQAGLQKDPRAALAYAWGAGGVAAIQLRDPKDGETSRAVERALKALQAFPEAPVLRIETGAEARSQGFPRAAFVVYLRPGFVEGGDADGPVLRPATVRGAHGYDSALAPMDAVLVLAGPGVPEGKDLGRVDMRDVAPTLARLLGTALPSAEGRDLLAVPAEATTTSELTPNHHAP